MAQLIKLYDYISRYESDIHQYPSKYIRLKQENWRKMKSLWENGELVSEQEDHTEDVEERTTKRSLFLKKKKQPRKEKSIETKQWIPSTEHELKQYFLDGLLPFQIKWASTTLIEKSFVDKKTSNDEHLKLLLQRLPDHYLVMYKPIVELKKAPMEAEIILIGPYEIELITFVDVEDGTIHPSNQHHWHIKQGNSNQKIFSPLIGLKRTETFLRSVLQKYENDFSFKHVVLAPNLTIEGAQEPYLTTFIDQNSFEHWLSEKRKLSMPIKHGQLRVAGQLLHHTKTVAVRRPEWELDTIKKEE
ncbi:nuclease-related domain-containing protein [Halobacillus seohaensis]|uniref:Nuclease-related domain-containing protein n=1 Tax=Halobacillus seohaensis TaxID=447421 RepID=A0ABW2EGL8_9BACI